MSADDSLVVSLVVGAVLFVALVAGVLLASGGVPQ